MVCGIEAIHARCWVVLGAVQFLRNYIDCKHMVGHPCTEETKRKISLAKIGKPNGLKGRPNGRLGTHHTDETKRKISEALKGKTRTEEQRQRMRDAPRRVRVKTVANKKERVAMIDDGEDEYPIEIDDLFA